MTDEEVKEYIDLTIKMTISEYKKKGLLKDSNNAAYEDASEILSSYYKSGMQDKKITYAIQGIRFDPYFRIIPMFYEEGKTIECIADNLGVDVSTVMRNKKRLCLLIYNEII